MRMLRVTLVLARPAVVALLGMFTAVGMAAAGEPDDPLLLARALVVVAAFLLFAISVNDLADEAIDRVNLAGDPRRPLVVGTATHRQMRIVAGVAAVVALGGGIALGGPIVLVILGGLVFATRLLDTPVAAGEPRDRRAAVAAARLRRRPVSDGCLRGPAVAHDTRPGVDDRSVCRVHRPHRPQGLS